MRDLTRHRPAPRAKAGRRSSALPNNNMDGGHALAANGLLLRGVVVATYVQVDEDAFPVEAGFERPVGIYCDVLVYSSMEGMREGLIRRALVSQPNAGIHEGRVWKPRAAKQDFAQGEIKEDSNPRDLDGDHVLIGFMDNTYTQPVILRGVPHPRTGQGNDDLTEAGHRHRLELADGEPDFWKHRGAFHGVDDKGNYVIDTTRAMGGEYEEDGGETPAEDADHGNVTVKVAATAKHTIIGLDAAGENPVFEVVIEDNKVTMKLQDGDSFVLENNAGDATLKIGDGAKHAAIVEALEILWNNTKTAIDSWQSHTHPDGFGSTGPAASPPNFPSWDSSINSSKVSFPDG